MRRYGALPLAIVTAIFGIPGHLDDAEAWLKMLKSLVAADWQWWNILLVSFSGILAVYALLPQRAVDALWARFIGVAETGAKPAEEPKAVGNVAPADQTQTDRRLQPEKRIYTHRSIGDILTTVRDMTSMDIDGFGQPHIGKWIRVQSVVRDIIQHDDYYAVLLGRMLDPMVLLSFARDEWSEIATMTQGKRLAAEGRITRIDRMAVSMDRCELVQLEEKDDVLRPP